MTSCNQLPVERTLSRCVDEVVLQDLGVCRGNCADVCTPSIGVVRNTALSEGHGDQRVRLLLIDETCEVALARDDVGDRDRVRRNIIDNAVRHAEQVVHDGYPHAFFQVLHHQRGGLKLLVCQNILLLGWVKLAFRPTFILPHIYSSVNLPYTSTDEEDTDNFAFPRDVRWCIKYINVMESATTKGV